MAFPQDLVCTETQTKTKHSKYSKINRITKTYKRKLKKLFLVPSPSFGLLKLLFPFKQSLPDKTAPFIAVVGKLFQLINVNIQALQVALSNVFVAKPVLAEGGVHGGETGTSKHFFVIIVY